MTRLRKMVTKERLTRQMNEVLTSQDEDNVPLSRLRGLKLSARETNKRIRKQKENEEMPVTKKAKLERRPEDYAQSVGELSKVTGEGEKKKCHYEAFKFYSRQYGLDDSVLLVPEDANQKPYVAIIKDIYKQGKEGYVKLDVQWFYRPEDVEKKQVENWELKDSRDLFYSFHRDEVFAESVKHKCVVHFVPENKQIPNRKEHPGFIVQNVYDYHKKKLRNFTYDGFNVQQKHDIDRLVANTVSRVGHLPDIVKKQNNLISGVGHLPDIVKKQNNLISGVGHFPDIVKKQNNLISGVGHLPDIVKKQNNLISGVGHLPDIVKKQNNLISKRKRSVPKRFIAKAKETSHGNCSTEVNLFDYDSVLENFDLLTGDSDRDKSLKELLKAVKYVCCTSLKKQAGDYDFVWPKDVVPVVRALEQALHVSFAEDIPKYNYKVENLVDTIKNSQVLALRLLNGELKPEQAIMRYEQTRGFTFDEEKADFEELMLKKYAPSTSNSVGRIHSVEDKRRN